MQKVLIVDDEQLARGYIRDLIDWFQFGMEVLGEAGDGEVALQYFDTYEPDIVITDIKMPFMTGIELLRKVKKRNPKTQVIIISSYDDFCYAQEAIKYGAAAYLLKPIIASELQDVLARLETVAKIDAELVSDRAKKLSKTEDICWQLISGSIEVEEACRQMELIDSGISNSYFKVVLYLLDDGHLLQQQLSAEDMRHLTEQMQKAVEEIYNGGKERNLIFGAYQGTSVIQCVLGKNPWKLDTTIESSIAQMRNLMEGMSVSVIVGESRLGLEGLVESRKQTQVLMSYRFLLGKNRNIFFNEISCFQEKPTKNAAEKNLNIHQMVDSLSFTNKQELLDGIRKIQAQIIQQGADSRFFAMLIMSSIISKTLSMLKESSIDQEVVNDQILQLKQVLFLDTIHESFESLCTALDALMDVVVAQRRNKYSMTIQKAKEYIEKNYMKKNLALQDVAQHLFLSVAYFSVLFKRETESTFLAYLTRVRMEKAKEMLLTNAYSIYNISEAVGYDNPTYFSTLFKRYYGMSPRDFKNKYGHKK